MNNKKYNEKYHKGRNELTRYSSNVILKIILNNFNVCSAVDVGGGIGVWLDEFKNLVQNNFKYGYVLDGAVVNNRLIEEDEFILCDLENKIELKQKFDLVICLEVAEHLPKTRAESFVDDLTELGDLILFSAAIPYQGGTGHINEQPVSYWVNLFDRRGYKAFDIIRPHIYRDKNIPFWYRNNMMLYCKSGSAEFEKCKRIQVEQMYDVVTLDVYMNKARIIDKIANSLIYKCFAKCRDIFEKIKRVS
jgi:hypothetical protein